MTKADWIKICEDYNPPPCDPDLCGIMGVPCPRCQPNQAKVWVKMNMNDGRDLTRDIKDKEPPF